MSTLSETWISELWIHLLDVSSATISEHFSPLRAYPSPAARLQAPRTKATTPWEKAIIPAEEVMFARSLHRASLTLVKGVLTLLTSSMADRKPASSYIELGSIFCGGSPRCLIDMPAERESAETPSSPYGLSERSARISRLDVLINRKALNAKLYLLR